MTVNYDTYIAEKKAFFEKHDYNYKCDTSSMDMYGRYTKTYSFEDGAQWMELMSDEYVEQEVEVKLVKMNVKFHLFKTEFWSTESGSKYYYEKY